ncbi:MAG: YraN family protein [Clostridia bacterium]|nr:YraN family protein [Clostridia bacterium]
MKNKELGAFGEILAQKRLEDKGYGFICKNYRGDGCEIDLIMEDGNTLVFVEVKTRSDMSFSSGRSAVNFKKQQHMMRAAQRFLIENEMQLRRCRMDVVEIDMKNKTICHIKSAFTI